MGPRVKGLRFTCAGEKSGECGLRHLSVARAARCLHRNRVMQPDSDRRVWRKRLDGALAELAESEQTELVVCLSKLGRGR